ncbi:MAG TPA: tRNA (adenosine(37)-N6)-threonylcarbamoyltransferase complex dimerization subunit type 1 TsaB [Candidatus Sulfotelmatobacter sp.]|jgi:tRNA threonylcarbamoyl adenosine modification protein YeaZ|nr:tRNA (adenosine(37)-N6)-threonylcarbamoyltransferase complex dimerization subunit type 1 TsaB [Candidatus Sulfotelmatobacter sp.]
MIVLALEFSSDRRSAALARGGTVLAEAVEQTADRTTRAFRLVEQVLSAAKLSREEIEVIAVGLGPGSYTGIRAAIAMAQGWQLARGIKLLGINSVEAMAAQAQVEKIFGRIHFAVDAQRGEFYLAGWEISEGGREEILPLKIVPAAAIISQKTAGEICLGPEQERRFFPAAAALARLAGGRQDFVPDGQLVPIYLRETAFVKSPAGRQI